MAIPKIDKPEQISGIIRRLPYTAQADRRPTVEELLKAIGKFLQTGKMKGSEAARLRIMLQRFRQP